MARNGSGTFNLPAGNPIASASVSNSTVRNNTFTEIATALTDSMARNGEAPATGDMPFGDNKITGLKPATDRTDGASIAVIQDGVGVNAASVGGTADVITLVMSPVITAYVTGQQFSFVAGGANTTGVTVNIDSVGAKALTKRGATALAANDILNNALILMEYDGTQFQMVSPAGSEAAGGTMSSQDSDAVSITGGTITGITDITVADGGTGASTHTANSVLIGEGTSAISSVAPSTNGNVLTSDGTNWSSEAAGGASTATTTTEGIVELATAAEVITGTDAGRVVTPATLPAGETGQVGLVELATDAEVLTGTDTARVPSVASMRNSLIWESPWTSLGTGTTSDIGSIPAWVKHVDVVVSQLSTNGTSHHLIQFGDSVGIETTGYDTVSYGAGLTCTTSTAGFISKGASASQNYTGMYHFHHVGSNKWVGSGNMAGNCLLMNAGDKTLSGTLTQMRMTTVGGTQVFDDGDWMIVGW